MKSVTKDGFTPLVLFSIHRGIERKGSEALYVVDPIDEYAVQQSKS
jgi:hypothetical protein